MLIGDEDKVVNPDDTDTSVEGVADKETGDTADASAETEKTGDKSGSQAVPYERFKEVNDAKKRAEEGLNSALIQIKELTAKQKNAIADGNKPLFDDPQQQAFYEKYVLPATKPMMDELKQTKETWAVTQERTRIDSELKSLAVKYPKMRRNEVLAAFIVNPDSSLADLAKQSHDERVKEKQDTIDEYRRGKEKDSQHKSVTPAGGAPSASVAKPPKNMSFSDRLANAAKAAAGRLSGAEK